jgi:NADH-quinone oxidoreductase subunit C
MLEALQSQFGEAITSAEQVGRELRLRVSANLIQDIARCCKEQGFTYAADITATDTGTELHVVYRLVRLETGEQIVIRAPVSRTGGRLPSLCGVFAGAEWPEREVYDLFGVRFDGHPDLRRILLTDDWEGHPLLKTSSR